MEWLIAVLIVWLVGIPILAYLMGKYSLTNSVDATFIVLFWPIVFPLLIVVALIEKIVKAGRNAKP